MSGKNKQAFFKPHERDNIENTNFSLFKIPKLWVCKCTVWCYCESCWNNTIQYVLKYSVS